MAENRITTRIVTRNDTSANWQEKNPVLLKGEQGIATDLNKVKFGDGVTAWNDLPYSGLSADEVQALVPRDDYTILDRTAAETDAEKLATIVSPNQGDIAVVRVEIADGKYQYTGYVYDDDSNWKAMDGNYNAENVYFGSDIIVTTAIGNIKLTNGQGTIPSEGKNLKQTFEAILTQEKDPNATNPSVSIKLAEAKSYEAGTMVTPTYTTSFNAGSYTYGPATGITVSSYSVKDSNNVTKTTANGSFDEIQVTDGMNYKLSVTAAYTEGAIPVSNLGNPVASKKINAGNATANSSSITSYRNFFYGALATSTADAPLTSAIIRGLKAGGAASSKTLPTYAASSVAGAKRVVVAIPVSSGKVVKKVLMPSAMNADATDSFVQKDNVTVEGANGYTGVEYKVWVYEPASLDSTETYAITIG